jgi:hypothetical protein
MQSVQLACHSRESASRLSAGCIRSTNHQVKRVAGIHPPTLSFDSGSIWHRYSRPELHHPLPLLSMTPELQAKMFTVKANFHTTYRVTENCSVGGSELVIFMEPDVGRDRSTATTPPPLSVPQCADFSQDEYLVSMLVRYMTKAYISQGRSRHMLENSMLRPVACH